MLLLTLIHTAISLVGIFSGLVVARGLVTANRMDSWTSLFLTTTVLTSVTGYFFPADHIKPSHVVGAISLLFLAAAIGARYRYRLAGSWRWIYVVGSVVALYLNCFVLVVQLFAKIPPLTALAPTQSEPPFVVAQVGLMALFVVLGVYAVRRFHPEGSGTKSGPEAGGPVLASS